MQLSDDLIWKQCHLVGNWLISNNGLVYSTKNNKLLKQTLTGIEGNKYLTVSHRFNGQIKHLKVHRLVAHLFCENPHKKTYVNHKDGNKLNNNDWNLEWATPSENIQHAIDTGLNPKKGSDNHNAVLDENKVFQIRNLSSLGKPQKELAKIFNVSQPVISRIINKKIWNHATA